MLGPIDYVVVGFKGNNFDGSIVDELAEAVRNRIIRVIDLMLIVKDADGQVAAGEIKDQPEELKLALEDLGVTDDTPLLTEDDMDKTAAEMENDTAAGVLVIEHLWAKGLKRALRDAGGFLIADGRIHPEVVEEAAREMREAEAAA
ncbi:MAG TPA: DUF6325 family protein [Candidatus Saccharimonas sp.]|nr:DUF6325 family protein [Candidatus Saccharimonas sp.]